MTENEALKLMESLVIDTKCELVKTLDFKETVIRALEDLQQYRAIGTVEGYENAIKAYTETYILMKEYKSKSKDFEAIGTIEEFKALKECFGHTTPKSRGKAIYDKAIDEFAGRMSLEISESIIWGMLVNSDKDNSFNDTSDKIVDYVIDTAKKIAEEMRGAE